MPSQSRRRLTPSLRLVDALLDRWAQWSAGELERLGWGRSMSQKLIEWHELGVEPDHYRGLQVIEACPDGVLMIDRLVARLEHPLHTAVCVHYFTYAPVEAKAKRAHMSVPQFRRCLDRAMWALHETIKALELDFDVDARIKNL